MKIKPVKPLKPSEQYDIDERGRIRPVRNWNWILDKWKDYPSFEDVITSIASSPVFQEDILSPRPWNGVTPEEWDDIVAKRYLDIEDGFNLASGIDVRRSLRAFYWRDEVFFAVRPDFGYRTLITDFQEPCINEAESTVQDLMLECGNLASSLYRAVQASELNPLELYPVEWWQDFWKLRHVNLAPHSPLAGAVNWPWGSHQTKLLEKLAAAAQKFWSNYDPAEKDTAPTNEVIINWLIAEGVSKRVAEVMAQILRADGLPPGPRK